MPQLVDSDLSGVSCVGGGYMQLDVGGGSENPPPPGDRMTVLPTGALLEDGGPPPPADLGLSRSTSEVLRQPLQKLSDIDRLELARERDEVRSVRGELRNVPPGQHARYREELEAQDELKRALREMLERTGEEDRFTLETLLRAVEAGQPDWAGGFSGREATSSGRGLQPAAGRHHGAARDGVPAKILVALVVASMAITARKLRLGSRLLQACGAVKQWCHLLWCCHLAEFVGVQQNLAVDTAKQLLTGLSPARQARQSEAGSRSISETGSADVFGYNTGVNRGGRLWLRPWRWFGRRGKPAAEIMSPPPLAPSASLYAGSSSPAKAALYGMTSGGNRMPMLPPRQRHSMDPSALSALSRKWQPHPVPTFGSLQRRSMSTAEAMLAASSPRADASGTAEGFSFRTYVEHDVQLSGLRPSSSEGDLMAACEQGCADGGAMAIPSSPSAHSLQTFSFNAPPLATHIKADFLTARTTSFREWQQNSTSPPPQQVAQSSSCSFLQVDAASEGCKGTGPSAPQGAKVPELPVGVIPPGLPRSLSAETLAMSSGGVSFRTLVEDAADLPTPASSPPVKPANSSHGFFAPSAQEVC